MIINYKIYEGFLSKNNFKKYQNYCDDLYNRIIKYIKEYTNYYVLKTVKENIVEINILNKTKDISIFCIKFNYKTFENIEIKYTLNEYYNNLTFANSLTYHIIDLNYSLTNTILYNISCIKKEDNINYIKHHIDVVFYNMNKYPNSYDEKYLEYTINNIFTKYYDEIVDYILSTDLKFINIIDFKRCSKEIKDKYEHYKNASNFDLL